MSELPKHFDYQTEEPNIYKRWLDSGGFSPQGQGEPRCIIMPPPNANNPLHVGHAFEVAIQDTFIRYWRMRSYKTLWQPGFDHAGFETQVVFEKKLEKEGRSRFGMERQQLYDEILAYSKENQSVIRGQFERLGASCDWSRVKFTLDPPIVKRVYQVFKQMYDDGLVYRDKRPVHWCTKHQTSLSDLEVRDEERTDPLYYMKYGPFTLATVRPETKFGDTAVAVNPNDERYKKYIGQDIKFEGLIGPIELKVIADDYVNPEFGTGVVKITPAHDPNDFAIGQRHHLEVKEVIDKYGKLNQFTGPYAGLKVAEARKKVAEDLQAKGLMDKVDEQYTHTVKVCYKCGTVIEPRILDQWFVSWTKPLKGSASLRDRAVAAVKSQQSQFISSKYANQFYSWMDNLLDWNISRQIAWGIPLPIWYDKDGNAIVTDGEPPTNAHELTRDPDVFDTWFSSGQWPYVTLEANGGSDFATFYPTTLIAPGYDILPFWVVRMILFSLYVHNEVPFKFIYLHGLVRDKDRQKMSKSKGNVIDPLGVASEYGADALRFALLYGNAPGTDPIISEEKIRGMRNFTTKLWNIARFIALQGDAPANPQFTSTEDFHQDIQQALQSCIQAVTEAMDTYQLHLAAETVYSFVWHELADKYIEASKERLATDDTKAAELNNLHSILKVTLRLAHPFMPFVTEGIWQQLYAHDDCLMLQDWPHV